METQKHGNTETHTDSDKYSIDVFCKNATIIRYFLVLPDPQKELNSIYQEA